jgi:hypothetical protein
VVDVEAEAGFAFVKKNWRPLLEAYWRQLAVGGLRRYVWLGRGKHLLLPSFKDFKEVYFSVLKEVRREEGRPLEVFGSLDMVMEPKVVEVYSEVELPVEARLGAFDLDMKHQEAPPDEALTRFAEALDYLVKWGILPELRLSGGGVHATFPLYPAPVDVLEANRRLAEHLSSRFKLRFDPAIYSEHRLFRLSFSWHKSGVFSIPLRPWELEELKWEDLRRLAGTPSEVEARLLDYRWTWKPLGELEDPEKACKLFRLLKPLDLPQPMVLRIAPRWKGGRRGQRELSEPELEELYSILRPFYEPGSRHRMLLGLSGLAAKLGVSPLSVAKVVKRLHDETNDERDIRTRGSCIVYSYARVGVPVDKKLLAEVLGAEPHGPSGPQQGYRVMGSSALYEVFRERLGEEEARKLLTKVKSLLAGKGLLRLGKAASVPFTGYTR